MSQEQVTPYGGSPGEMYERYMVPTIFAPWAQDLVALATLQPGERVLDVACGTGVVTRLAAVELVGTGRIVGLDLNSTMLAAARAAAADLPIEWYERDATELPFESDTFDVVLCQQGLQFIPDKLAALREMHRVLAPGGRVLLSAWRSTRDIPGWRVLEEALGQHLGRRVALPPFTFGDARELRRLLDDVGFRDISIRADVKMSRFPSPEAFVRSAVAGSPSMLGPVAEQDESGLALIVAEVATELATSLDDQGLAFPQASNIASARK
jgi:ubiquinone/menaquinone biosynthesis C-methylase UbiE